MTRKRWLLLCLSVFLISGCGSRLKDMFSFRGQNAGGELQARLDEAQLLFMAGDYEGAQSVFETLQGSENPNVLGPALYGLACSRFMLATSRQEYQDAVSSLERWRQMPRTGQNREDPRMLLAVLSKPVPEPAENETPDSPDSTENLFLSVFSCRERISELEAQIGRLEKVAAAYEGQKRSMAELETANRALKDSLKATEKAEGGMVEEISKLRQQIRTLETIDQEIQEKKQGISAP